MRGITLINQAKEESTAYQGVREACVQAICLRVSEELHSWILILIIDFGLWRADACRVYILGFDMKSMHYVPQPVISMLI